MNEKVGNAVNGKNLRMGDHIWIDGLLVSGDFVDVVLYYTITLVSIPQVLWFLKLSSSDILGCFVEGSGTP